MIHKSNFKPEIPVVECWAFYYIKVKGKYEVFPRNIGTKEVITKYKLYESLSRPNKITKQLLSIASLLLNITIWLISFLAILAYPFYMYFVGAKNFINDSAWLNGVRYFSWVNFILALGSVIGLLIIKLT